MVQNFFDDYILSGCKLIYMAAVDNTIMFWWSSPYKLFGGRH